MTPDITPLDQWLSEATRGLSPESAAQVRAEIQQHYDSACEAGGDALAALGDPRATNRAYRKVLLTEQEAIMAPVLTQPKRPSLRKMLLTSASVAAFLWLLGPKYRGPEFWPVMIAIFCVIPVRWFFPQTTLERSRAYIYATAVRSILIVAIAWWHENWIYGLALGAVCFLFDSFFSYRRLSIFRKLATGQTYNPLPGEPRLTHPEAIWLRTLHQGSPHEKISIAVVFLILAGMVIWLPATFAPMAICMAAGFVAGRTFPIYTEQRSHWFRLGKWTTMALAAVLPVLYGARIPWIGAAYIALFFVLWDVKSIRLRRKLPVEQWPKRLYW